jgi:hypothetical protein
LGKGYTGIMADILSYAIKHPEILAKAQWPKPITIIQKLKEMGPLSLMLAHFEEYKSQVTGNYQVKN